ncbi:MAG: phosphoribosylanthranilate isomerase [Selenomonadaceae bacterium]|nr:phosphoribosylanthranilate isomerase [Selenomonadaceae bacterium]
MTKVKFCGLSRIEDIIAANDLEPDYIGFVFAKGSKRQVSFDAACKLKTALSKKIKSVGVFVNEEVKKTANIANDGVIDIIQLHGDEDGEYIKTLRSLTDKPIIQAVILKEDLSVKKANDSPADFVLLDAGRGEGKIFDWELTKKIIRPYFLAGGLNDKNVAEAVAKLNPYAVDVSGGIETNGKKDHAKMKSFLRVVNDIPDNVWRKESK